MSEEHITVASPEPAAPAGGADADVVISKIGGEWNIRLRSTKAVQSQSGTTTDEDGMNLAFKDCSIIQLKNDDSPADDRHKKWLNEMRGWLMVVATVAASVSYQAGLNPPGGFWQDDPTDRSHHAGDPALRDEHRSRYLTFYYLNATAFVTSLVIVVLLMCERFYDTELRVLVLMFTTFVDLASLIGAYTAGTTRYFSSCIYLIVITCVAFVCVIYIGEVITDLCAIVMAHFPCMERLAEKRWSPITEGVLQQAKMEKEAMEKRKARRKQHGNARMSNTGTCCVCCA